MEDKQVKIISAMWVGGPPGRTLVKLKNKLLVLGIDIVSCVDVQDIKRIKSIPKNIDVVLINHKMCKHKLQIKIKKIAASSGVTCCFSSLNTIETVQNLKLIGLM